MEMAGPWLFCNYCFIKSGYQILIKNAANDFYGQRRL